MTSGNTKGTLGEPPQLFVVALQSDSVSVQRSLTVAESEKLYMRYRENL